MKLEIRALSTFVTSEKADAIDEGNKTNSTKKSKSKAAKVTDEDEDFR